MGDGNWFHQGRRRTRRSKRHTNGKAKRNRGRSARPQGIASLGVEHLEDRRMLATFMVTDAGDLDQNQAIIFGSLRWAIGQANATDAGDTIIFADTLFVNGPATINLDPRAAGDQLLITSPLQILGPGPGQLTINQTKVNRRIFETNIGAIDEIFSVEISGVTLSGGNLVGFADTARGGAIYNREALTMVETIVTGNSAGNGGGAIFIQRGNLTLDRSLVQNNTAGVGGGIMHGAKADDDSPGMSRIINSTLTGNRAVGVPNSMDYQGPWGGAVFNRNGRLQIVNSTITGNFASGANNGAGVASFGNPLQASPPPTPAAVPVPNVRTYIGNSIIWRNGAAPTDTDVDRVGRETAAPNRDLYPSFFPLNVAILAPGAMTPAGSMGNNIVGDGNAAAAGQDLAFTPAEVQPDTAIVLELSGGLNPQPFLADRGGSTPVFYLDPTGIAVDAGNSALAAGNFDQRGRHFTRTFDFGPVTPPASRRDIGAVELQDGSFVVDVLKDDFDEQFSKVWRNLSTQPGVFQFDTSAPYTSAGDFSLREAIDFASKNPHPNTITFAASLRTAETPGAVPNPPTILLTRGLENGLPGSDGVLSLASITTPLTIQGPTTFTLEIDASGNDPTPVGNEGNGSRVFYIDNNSSASVLDITIANLTLMGADVFGVGGAIYNRENLTLRNMTFKDNNATDDGGALYVHAGTVNIDNSTFNSNRAGDDGGAIYIDRLPPAGALPTVNIVNSTFSANTAGNRGGAIVNNNGTAHISYSTITLNTAASNRGTGVWNSSTATLTDFKSTIVSANSATQDNVIDNDVESETPGAPNITSLGFNFVGGGNASPVSIPSGRFNLATDLARRANPMLGQLFNTGGPTETHRPLTGSPVIDAGETAPTPANDQRGAPFVRLFDGDATPGARADIGAYELQSSIFTVDNSDDENDGNFATGDLSLREAIQLANDNPLPDTILFAPLVVGLGATWNLGSANLPPNTTQDIKITASVIIDNSANGGSAFLILNGAGLIDRGPNPDEGRRLFTIDDGSANSNISVTIKGITLTGMQAAQAGGAIFSRENLTLDDVVFINNSTIGDGFSGGAIYIEKPAGAPPAQDVQLVVTGSRFTGNVTNGVNSDGAVIYAKDAGVRISGTQISGNSTVKTQSDGGAIFIKSSVTSSAANFDLDADVDGADFLAWQMNFGRVGANKSEGDANGDAVVDGADLAIWKQQNGTVGNQGGTLSIGDNSSITGNFTTAGDADGGGIYSDGGEILFRNSEAVLSGNHTKGSNSEGGGLAVRNGNVYLNKAIVSLNSTLGNQSPGGGIYIGTTGGGTSTVSLVDSIVEKNFTQGQLANGGGIAIENATLVTRNSTIDENTVNGANSHGGGISNVGGNLVVRDSTIAENRALHSSTAKGGGVYTDTNLAGTQTTRIINSTVSGNIGMFRGGGVFNADGLTEILHSTVTDNETQFLNLGAGIASQGNSATITRLQSTIVAGNRGAAAGTQTDIDYVDGGTNSFQSLGYNLLGSGNALAAFPTPTNIKGVNGVTDPALVGLAPLADNGGLAALPAGLNPFTHALLPGSLAINAGDPAFDPASFNPALLFDQRGSGNLRKLGGRIDIGAFESTFAAVAAAEAGGLAASIPWISAALTAESSDESVPVEGEPQADQLRPHLIAFDDWSPATQDDSFVLARRTNTAGDDDASEDLSAEDAAFARLAGELLL